MDLGGNDIILSAFGKLDRLLDHYVRPERQEADFANHQAFFWDGTRRMLRPVTRPVRNDPADLVGIEQHKQELLTNTKRFVEGCKANNALLWGERGTGKSSLIKSLLSAFSGTSLRMVQVLKHDILTVQELYEVFASHPSFRFIVFIDDLSFEEGQTDYKEMKTIMDGGLEQVPDNLLFYATSNRKHLIPTRFSDSDGDVIRPSDTMEEKVSLADRFGVRLGFYHIDQDTYLAIVDLYAGKAGISMDRETLYQQAIQWALQAGGRNGRIAEQFVRSLPGK
jgi:predicted AAA+ superfamily ATPase